MPTEVHDSCQDWWRLSENNLRRIGDLADDEKAQLGSSLARIRYRVQASLG